MEQKKRGMEFSLILDEDTLPIMKQISEGMPGGFFIYHADGNEELIYINSAMLRIFGCDTEEEFRKLTGNTFKGLVHPEDIDAVEASIATQIANSVYDLDYVEYRIIQKDGSICWVEDYGHFIHTKTYGDIFCVFIEDATERLKQRMNELENVNGELRNAYVRECQYRKAILYDAVSFFEINLTKDEFITTRTQMINGRRNDLFEFIDTQPFRKYSEYVEYRSHKTDEQYADEYRHFFKLERLIRCYERGDFEQTFDEWVTDNNGRKRLCHYIILIGKNDCCGDIVALFIAKDMTEQAERQNLLRTALVQAESAQIARNTFLSSMSHDIRTPLNAIIGYTELVKKNITEPDKIREYIDKICMSGRQLLYIVDASLEVTRMESGRAKLTERECHLVDLLADVEKMVLHSAQIKDIRFSIDKSKVQHFAVIADIIRLKEILYQLLDNAIKYNHVEGEVKLSVAESDIDCQGYGKYQFIVEDNGIGIAREFQEKLFEPFSRVNNTTQSGVLGTGLGLTLVKSLVSLMDGEVTVSSELGKGSRFTVSVLLKWQEEQDTYKSESIKLIDKTRLKGKRILLVEDNEMNAEIAQEMLEAQGFIIERAVNGRFALEKIKSSTPGYYSLILMDIQMPIMDGYEATREIRNLENKELSNIPIIALSANAFAEDYRKSLDAGMNAHFSKPVDFENLQELVYEVLSNTLF